MTAPGISVQLYTIREALGQDLEGSLARLREMGFTHVEPFLFTENTDRLAAALRDADLQAPSGHEQILGDDQDRIFSSAKELGIGTVIDNFREQDIWDNADTIRDAAERLNRAAEKAATYDLRIGYHNHHWELLNSFDGKTGLEVFAEHLAPGVVLELDTYWAAAGGANVPELITRLGDKVVLIHAKDGEIRQDFDGQTILGEGNMPVEDILRAATHLEYAVIEVDKYDGDLFDAVEGGYRFLDRVLR